MKRLVSLGKNTGAIVDDFVWFNKHALQMGEREREESGWCVIELIYNWDKWTIFTFK